MVLIIPYIFPSTFNALAVWPFIGWIDNVVKLLLVIALGAAEADPLSPEEPAPDADALSDPLLPALEGGAGGCKPSEPPDPLPD